MKGWLEEDAKRLIEMIESAPGGIPGMDNEAEMLVEDAETKIEDAQDALERVEAYYNRGEGNNEGLVKG